MPPNGVLPALPPGSGQLAREDRVLCLLRAKNSLVLNSQQFRQLSMGQSPIPHDGFGDLVQVRDLAFPTRAR